MARDSFDPWPGQGIVVDKRAILIGARRADLPSALCPVPFTHQALPMTVPSLLSSSGQE